MPSAKKDKTEIPGLKAWLSDPDIREVSLVKSPFIPCSPEANIQITKMFRDKVEPKLIAVAKAKEEAKPEEGQVRFQKRFRIQKIDSKERKIYGYVYPSNKADLEGDAMTPEELEKAAHSLLMNLTDKKTTGDGAGLNHEFFENIFKFTESAIDHDGSLGAAHGFYEPMGKAWFIGGYVPDDEIWKAIESGEITGFSWGGFATRTPVADAEQKAGFLHNALKSIKTAITKEEPLDFAEWQSVLEAGPEIDYMIWNLGDVIYWIMLSDKLLEEKITLVKKSILQFYQAVTEIFNNLPAFDLSPELAELIQKITRAKESLDSARDNIDGLQKTFESLNKGEEEMTPEELKKAMGEILDEKMEPVNEKLEEHGNKLQEFETKFTDLEKKLEPPEEEKKGKEGEETKANEEGEKDPTLKAIDELREAVKGMGDRLEKVETTPGVSRADDDQPEEDEGVEKTAQGVIKTKDGKHDYAAMMKGTTVDREKLASNL